ncbi:hypothetical protein [Rhizobium leguminosarum]|uniref:hypothetical protein n=1 Tax=Rhizobium leguminosarum TaxID=384 RepID=UPI0013B9F541|nr:hypothetical protein [Rhizobium leguminosarum]NEH72296.1 hypothetical protein [Rhizobium leguminosarum]
MAELVKTRVMRKGWTAQYFRQEHGADVAIEGLPASQPYLPGMQLKFSLPVPGGTTNVKIVVGPEDFEAFADAMMRTDGEAAARAFARAVFFSPKSKEVERRLYPTRGKKKKAD